MSQTLRFIGAETVNRLLDFPSLAARIGEAFLAPPAAPPRLAVAIEQSATQTPGTLLVMPAVRPGALIGVKLVTVLPELTERAGGALRSIYMVLDARSGEPIAVVDGHALTNRRTAATSVLAASVLARPDAHTLLLVGTGGVCAALAEAYHQVLDMRRILVWGRDPLKAADLAKTLENQGIPAEPTPDLEQGLLYADIVSSATLAREPILLGAQVRPGTHIDLVGGFRFNMRESDDALISNARLVADVAHTINEAGDLAQPIRAGVIAAADVTLLADLLAEMVPGRRTDAEVTVFKSAGHALEDLAAAELLFDRLS